MGQGRDGPGLVAEPGHDVPLRGPPETGVVDDGVLDAGELDVGLHGASVVARTGPPRSAGSARDAPASRVVGDAAPA